MNRGHEKLAEATRQPLLEDEWERIAAAAVLPLATLQARTRGRDLEDPKEALRELRAAEERERYRRRKAAMTPEELERKRARNRAYYHEHADEINARRARTTDTGGTE